MDTEACENNARERRTKKAVESITFAKREAECRASVRSVTFM